MILMEGTKYRSESEARKAKRTRMTTEQRARVELDAWKSVRGEDELQLSPSTLKSLLRPAKVDNKVSNGPKLKSLK